MRSLEDGESYAQLSSSIRVGWAALWWLFRRRHRHLRVAALLLDGEKLLPDQYRDHCHSPNLIPQSLTLEGYQRALTMIPFVRYLTNSMVIATATTVFSALLAARRLCDCPLPVSGRNGHTGDLSLHAVDPAHYACLSGLFLNQGLEPDQHVSGATIAYISFSLPYAVLMLSGYFRNSYPVELEDAALIDGCTLFSVFWRIVLPILPGIIAIATFTFLGVERLPSGPASCSTKDR